MLSRTTAYEDVIDGPAWDQAESWLKKYAQTPAGAARDVKLVGYSPCSAFDQYAQELNRMSVVDRVWHVNSLLAAMACQMVRELAPDGVAGQPGYDDFVGTPEVLGIAEAWSRRGVPTAQAAMQFRKLWHDAVLVRGGKRVYEVSPGLAEKLLYMKLTGLTTDDLKLPHPALYVTVPLRAGLQVFNDETGFHPLRGIYVAVDPGSLTARWRPAEMARYASVPSWRLLAWGPSKSENPFDDAIQYFSVLLPPEKTLDEALELSMAERAIDAGPGFGMEAFRWVLNVMLYATWPDADVEHVIMNPEARALWERHERAPKGSKKRAELLARFKAVPKPDRRIVLGRHVTVLGVAEERAARGEGKPLLTRSLVQGHWQHYWTGEGRTTKVRKWRQPFWRGPDDGPEGPSTHKLK